MDRAVQTEPGEARGLTAAWSEPGAPEKALGLGRTEGAGVTGDRRHQVLVPYRPAPRFLDRYLVTTSVARIPRALWLETEHQSE